MAFITTPAVYHKTWLVDFFHGFPHVDLSFVEINSTFNPENAKYRESLGVWGGVPMIICSLLWLAFLIFFCLRCCRKSERKQSSTTCFRLWAGLFLLCGCGSLAAAFYGNALVHEGTTNFVHAVKTTNKTIRNSMQVLHNLDRLANRTEEAGLPLLREAVESIPNVTVRAAVDKLIGSIGSNINGSRADFDSIEKDADGIDTSKISEPVNEVESYRWITTIVVFSVYIVIFILTFSGLLKSSRWILIIVSLAIIMFLAVIWGVTSAYLAFSIAASDLCMDPNTFVLSRVKETVKGDILTAYIDCTDQTKPYQEQILDSQTKVTQALTALNMTVNMSIPYHISDKLVGPVNMLRTDLKFAFGNLSSLITLVGSCDSLHSEYVTAVKAVCSTTLYGFGYLVLFCALVGLSNALMVVFSALAWPYFRRQRSRGPGVSYIPGDDTDPFLPDPPPYQQDYGSMARATRLRAERLSETDPINQTSVARPVMTRRPEGDSPPPAYQPGHFMQQYYNLAPRPSSIVQSSQTTT